MNAQKILITEDEVLVARELAETLEELGYEVTAIAHDGKTALQKVSETSPDLVLMDIVLPGQMDGIEVANFIRAHHHIPVVYLTAYADTETLDRAQITEPFGYLIKPFQAKALHTTIQVALNRHAVEQGKLKNLRQNISSFLPHELNTPLCTILSSLELLTEYYDNFSRYEVLERLWSVQNSATRLNRTCQNVLLYTELEILEQDLHQLERLQQDTTPSSYGVIKAQAYTKAEEMNRTADLQLELEDLPVRMCKHYLKRLVDELLDNAFKFSLPGTPVRLHSFLQDNSFYLAISDQGRGMTPEQIANLDAFVQFDRHRYEQQGLGLGLALVKRLVELHNGKLSIRSVVGEGTTVVVHLPI